MYNLISHQLLQNGTPVILTRKEKQLVQFLVEHMNTTMTYDAIAKKIWNGRPVNTATLRSLVRRIREKIGDEVIENITSIGYRISVKSSSKN
jgi:DNA-binding response OmpR family regulator